MAQRRDGFMGGGQPMFPGPDATQAYGLITYFKAEAEKALQRNDLRVAMQNYNEALNMVQGLSFVPFISEEFHKIICNRSLVNLKMGNYKNAERDAQLCIDCQPGFVKAYWRASQAAQQLQNGIPRALDHIMAGLRQLDEGNTEDMITFLTELCVLIQKAPKISRVYHTLSEIICVAPECNDTIWEKIVQRLAAGNHWESVSMLITGLHSGPSNDLEAYILGEVNCKGLNVGTLLRNITDPNLRAWGMELVEHLLRAGAPMKEMGRAFNKPTLHVAIRVTLQTGNLDLLKYMLNELFRVEDKNAQDSEGKTAFHALIESGKLHTTCGESVLRLLLNHNCNAGIPDKQNRRPLDLLRPTDTAYILLKKSIKTVDDLRKDLEALKSRGNMALKSGNHNEALRLYSEALDVSKQSKELDKEAAILYSNRANVLNKQQNYEEALPNANAAISYDVNWHKGHFWKATTLKNLGNISEAFAAFLDGLKKSTIPKQEEKTDFIVEAVLLLSQLQGKQLCECYQQLKFIRDVFEIWSSVLTRLSKSSEWKCIAYLILGPYLDRAGSRNRHNGDSLKSICNGVAGNASTQGVQMSTVFWYLRQTDLEYCSNWLDATLYAVYKHGDEDTLDYFIENRRDTPIHAAVRFSLITGKLSLLDELTSRKKTFSADFNNAEGDTLFHAITRHQPPPTTRHVMEVTELLMKKGYSAMVRNRTGKLPVDYLSTHYPGEVFDLFFRDSKHTSISDILSLKEKGNDLFKSGDVMEAVQQYNKAIRLVEATRGNAGLSDRQLAVLYGNRAEAYLKMKLFDEALDDARECVGYDSHWYKGHLRVGKALKGQGNMDFAVRAFVNSYCDIDKDEPESIRIDLMTELTSVCICVPRNRLNCLKRLPDFPKGQGHLWAKVAYQLIANKGNWDQAAIAYFQFNDGEASKLRCVVNLKPFCNLPMLKGYAWGMDLMKYFLLCGSDRNSIQLEKGQPYLHAVVQMTLKVAIQQYTSFLNFILDSYVRKFQEQNKIDTLGNTALHVATKEKGVEKGRRFQIIAMLLHADVDPTIRNISGSQAVELLPKGETRSLEHLRMAMYSASNRSTQTQQQGVKKEGQERKDTVTRILKRPVNTGCTSCEQMLNEARSLLGAANLKEGYEKVLELVKEKHRSEKHFGLVQKAMGCIVTKLGEAAVPEIPNSFGSFGRENVAMIIEALASKNKWRQLDTVVRKFRTLSPNEPLKNFATSMSVVPVLGMSASSLAEDTKLQILKTLISGGASLGTDGGVSALRHGVEQEQYKIVGELIKLGADTADLSLSPGDTPIHAIMTIVLEKGKAHHEKVNVLKFALEKFDEDPQSFSHLDPNQVDQSGDTLFHLVAKTKYTSTALSATELLCKHNLSASVYNNDGHLPSFYVKKQSDRRLQFIKLAAKVQAKPSIAKSEKDKNLSDSSLGAGVEEKGDNREIREVVRIATQKEIRKRKIEEKIRVLPDSKISIFNVEHTPSKQVHLDSVSEKGDNLEEIKGKGDKLVRKRLKVEGGKHEESSEEDKTLKLVVGEDLKTGEGEGKGEENKNSNVDENENNTKKIEDDERRELYDQVPAALNDGEGEVNVNDVIGDVRNDEVIICDVIDVDDDESENEEAEEEEEIIIDAQVFDNLEWEVECTADVWKTLRDKHVLPQLKQRIVRKIQLLATGEWQPHLCKKIHNVPASLNLFEAKFSKGSRIMWELAVAFSPRCSESAERRLLPDQGGEITHPVRGGRIYSEIIRVWDIVLDHDKIYRSVERIRKSHERGEDCIIQKKLRGIKADTLQVPVGVAKRYPMLYAECDVPSETIQETQQEMQQYFPPASANETEYHILKFYSFSSALVSHVLQNIETKVDFPFRVTDLEHAIINLKSQAPILLLGRSGTGKTTCCLYRLWSQFHNYWSKAKEADAPLLPRCLEFVHQEQESDESENSEEDDSTDIEDSEADATEGASEPDNSESCSEETEGTIYDHIHQVFITKNAVLCSEVQKNFRELSHADDLMHDHVVHEEENVPNRLQDVDDYLYPLFLTSRQLLLMLDASLGAPYFFDRKEDGSLKVDIAGWTDADGPLSILPLLDEDSDLEEDVEQYIDEDDDQEDMSRAATRKKTKVDPRREITYEVFVEEVWPRIKKKIGSSYHPSLVWMEIMSFIKGSFEALTKKSGYLQREEYFKLGRKRASNFSGERDKIYDFFLRYQHFKSQNSLFDETDLVHDVFRRLRTTEMRPWVIHQFFVDETQDFTQAELCLLIRLCQNPNDMFLTGDTAQSIMRGIAFRFSDLRSLFYHAKMSMHEMGKTSAVRVPKQVYQLTHNYRSHAGILSLASSVLELMVEFFPESFDRLRKDQGLFHGPQPILLESCSFSDLAVLLRGNRRKTSHIEFGAHQAILVVNDAAREGIPEELRLGLVLTIYEAKGLEFDDVLLYNFFKDSQAVKEWRVVTDYLERIHHSQNEAQQGTSHNPESLVELDESVLKQPDRPRPLEFDPNLHKVLNSELKHLYTALTRARVNVWIFDEDLDRRAPMFEYFKARKLVKRLTVSEVNEESLTETMFAEKSSSADWVKRGEDFMKHSLYSVAAKCFGMGGDENRQKVAIAHGQALVASRLKDNPRQMRDEFLHAAELYLDCNRPTKAAICLQNAREKELSAQLFEKLGQYERAAEIYKKMKRSMASSRCYELLGQYNRALIVLYENDYFDMAIDTLRRYKMLMQDLRQSGADIPIQLIEYKPDDYFTEERLSYRSADFYHHCKNEERMLDSLSRIERAQDRVRFLVEKGYMKHAARVLEENGEGREAAMVLLRCGKIDDAVTCARKTLQEDIIARCLLVHSRVVMSKVSEDTHKQATIQDLEEAVGMFQTCSDMSGLGEAELLLAELTEDDRKVDLAWKAFSNLKPFQNEAGLVECTDWLIRHDHLKKIGPIRLIVKGVGHLFDVCRVLLETSGQENQEKMRLFDKFYGLSPCGPSELQLNRKEKPICLPMMKDLIKVRSQKKNAPVEVPRLEAHETIVRFLLRRAYHWLRPIWNSLSEWREKASPCPYTMSGIVCPAQVNHDNPCRKIHRNQDQASYSKLIQMDILIVEFEYNVRAGARRLRSRCRANLSELVDLFMCAKTDPVDIRFEACKMLWDDIMPSVKYPDYVGNAKDFVKYLTEYNHEKVKFRMHDFLLERWNSATAGDKKLKCDAVKSTEVFLLLEFGSHLFRLTEGSRELNKIEPDREISKLETRITNEVRERNPAEYAKKITKYFTLMIDRKSHVVQCIGKRFSEAYTQMSNDYSNPYDAVYKFSKFCHLLITRGEVEFLPDMKHFLFWVEFYCTLAFLVIAKINWQNFPDFVFIVPDNYLSVVKFVEATFPKYTVEQVLAWWKPRKYLTSFDIQEQLQYIIWLISGFSTTIKLFQASFNNPSTPEEFAIAERLLIVGMTLIINVGKTVPLKCEISLVKEICKLNVGDHFPPRLQRALASLRMAHGIKDVYVALKTLLQERDREILMTCKWTSVGKIEKMQKDPLTSDMLFSDYFLNDKTLPTLLGLHATLNVSEIVKTTDDGELSDDEIEKGRRDQEYHRQYDRKQKAASVIVRCVRNFLQRRRQEKLAAFGDRAGRFTDVAQTFEEIQVDTTMCGICGVSFEHQLKSILDQETGNWAAGQSTTREPTPQEAYSGNLPRGFPSSPEPSKQSGVGDRSPEGQGFMGWIASKIPFIQSPTRESNMPPWFTGTQPVTEIEQRQKILLNIKNKHCQEQEHVQKLLEFRKFKRDYTEKIFPKVDTVREFMNNPEYRLRAEGKDHYTGMRMDISRLFGKLNEEQRLVEGALARKAWIEIGRLQQISMEISSDFERVRPYVIQMYQELREREEEEERQRRASSYSNTTAMYGNEDWDQELEELEPVVPEPRRHRNKEYRSKRYQSYRH